MKKEPKQLSVSADEIRQAAVIIGGRRLLIGDVFKVDARNTVFGGIRVTLTRGK